MTLEITNPVPEAPGGKTPALPIVLVLALVLAVGGCASEGGSFTVEALSDGVHLLRPAEGDAERTNSLVVEQAEGLVVVGAQPTPAAARELLRAVERLGSLPVRYLVIPHSHADAAGGASAFPETTLVVGTGPAHEALSDPEYDFGAEARARSKDPDGWVEPPRRMPGMLIHGRVDLDDEERPVRLLPAPRTHSRGDMMVYLPATDTMYVGSLLSRERNPYAKDAHVETWISALNHLIKTRPAQIVSLRGPRPDRELLRERRDAFAWVRSHVSQGFIDGVAPAAIPDRVLASAEIAEYFDLEASPSYASSVVAQALDEVIQFRRRRGLE